MTELQKIKDKYAKELGYSSWSALPYNCNTESRNNEIARRYAIECVKASLAKASDNCNSEFVVNRLKSTLYVQHAITSPDNIVLV